MATSHTGADRIDADSSRVEIEEIAHIERQLRGSSVFNVSVHLGGSRETARIGFDTHLRNESFRGSILGSVVEELAGSGWRVEHIHDPMDYIPESGPKAGEEVTGSMITIRTEESR